MTEQSFIKKFLKHSAEFQDADGAYEFAIDGTDYILDTTSTGRVLLWRDYGTLIAWAEDCDYQAFAQIAFEQTAKEAAK